jgi:hypothetical protein
MDAPIPHFWLDVHDYRAAIRAGLLAPMGTEELDEQPQWWVEKLVAYTNLCNEADVAKRAMKNA